MLTNMILLTPAAMAPAVSASNDAASAAVLAGAADATKKFAAATANVTAATATVATAITAAAKAVVRACAAAASACGAALLVLWTRCQLALQHLFGGAATQDATPCMCACACACVLSPTVPTKTETDTAILVKIPAPSLTATATPKDVADSSEQLVATATDEDAYDAPTDATVRTVATVATDGCAHAIGIANEPEEEEEPAPAPALVLLQELAEHKPVVDESIMARYRSQLMARHAALGRTPVPSDTVLLIISWLVAQNRGQAFLLAYPFAIVDIVLRALAWHDHDVAATVGGLARHWMRDYRCMRILRKLAPTRRDEVDALRLKLSTAYTSSH